MSGYGVDDEAGAGADADWFRPVWADDEAESAGAAPPWSPPTAARRHPAIATSARWDRDPHALATMLVPALAASDALARLDARAGTASEPVREGLVRRLALHEAAGWLAAQVAWVHPLDLALRAGNLAGPFGLAAVAGRVGAGMPNTAAAGKGAPAQDDAGALAAWPAAFCRLAREAALAGLRELDRLEQGAERGRAAADGADRRSRLPDALDAALRVPALTSTMLASRLDVAPQTATALLRDLLAAGVVREVTGRKHFRAFAA